MGDYDKIYENILDRPDGPHFRLLTLLPRKDDTTVDKYYDDPESEYDYEDDKDEIEESRFNQTEAHGLVSPKGPPGLSTPNKEPIATDIEVELSVHPLNNCPEYEALSYSWGDDTGRKYFITCNGQRFAALRNLSNALLALRLPDRPRTLWIDAICINQSSEPHALEERGQQVAMMQHIYRRASKAVVWLGTTGERNFSPAFQNHPLDHQILRLHNMNAVLKEFVPSLEELLAFTIETLATDPAELWQGRSEVKVKWDNRQDLVKLAARTVMSDWERRTDRDPRDVDLEKIVRESMPVHMPRWARAASRKIMMMPKNREMVLETMAEWGAWRLALPNILCRDWWSRKWIIQEACLAADVVYLCGDISFGLDLLFLGMTLYSVFSDKPHFRGQLPSSWTLMDVMEYRCLYQRNTGTCLPSFLHLLQKFRSSDAKNPVDHVYALMGLVGSDELAALNREDCKPNYSADMTAYRCYLETARAICITTNSLDILLFGHGQARTASKFVDAPLPSWVPNWAVKTDEKLYPTHGVKSSEPMSSEPLFSACGDCLAWTPLFRGDTTLVISGYVADTVTKLTPKAMLSLDEMVAKFTNGENMIDEMLEHEQGFYGGLVASAALLGDFFGMFIEWEQFALSRCDPYPTGEDMRRVFCAVRCYGRAPEGSDEAFRAFNEYMDAFSMTRRAYGLATSSKRRPFAFRKPAARGDKTGPSSALGKALVAAASLDKKRMSRLQKFNALQGLSVGRKLAWTRRGFLALVPDNIRTGDKVVLCKGSRQPLMMRVVEHRSQWQLLGPCYVHGMMRGEVWDERLCEDIELV